MKVTGAADVRRLNNSCSTGQQPCRLHNRHGELVTQIEIPEEMFDVILWEGRAFIPNQSGVNTRGAGGAVIFVEAFTLSIEENGQ